LAAFGQCERLAAAVVGEPQPLDQVGLLEARDEL
jgi:hypothetical protein